MLPETQNANRHSCRFFHRCWKVGLGRDERALSEEWVLVSAVSWACTRKETKLMEHVTWGNLRLFSGPSSVLVHGDMWSPQFLWRRDKLAAIVDWQISHRGSFVSFHSTKKNEKEKILSDGGHPSSNDVVHTSSWEEEIPGVSLTLSNCTPCSVVNQFGFELPL